MSFTGKVVVVVTGYGRLGRAVGDGFAQEGARVVLAAPDEQPGYEPAAANISTIAVNPTEQRDIARFCQTVDEQAGRLDVLVDCAQYQVGKSCMDLTLAEWQRGLDMNLTARYLWLKHAIPMMRRAGVARLST